jgi:hypothetical protein
MSDLFARLTAGLSILIAGASLYISYQSANQANEKLSIKIIEDQFRFSSTGDAVSWQGAFDLYNESNRRLTITDIIVGTGYSWSGNTEPQNIRTSAHCEIDDFTATLVEPRTSALIPFVCTIRGRSQATAYLVEYLTLNSDARSVTEFLWKLYDEKGIDFFDVKLRDGLSGFPIAVTQRRYTDPEIGTVIAVPIKFLAWTRTENIFEEQYYIHLGATNYR